jgi:hypothetical protein
MKLHDGQDVFIRFRVLSHNKCIDNRTSYHLVSAGLPYYKILLDDNGKLENVQPERWPGDENAERQPVDKW